MMPLWRGDDIIVRSTLEIVSIRQPISALGTKNLRKNFPHIAEFTLPAFFCLSNTLTALQLSHIIHISFPQFFLDYGSIKRYNKQIA
jgi:hypothetical protein